MSRNFLPIMPASANMDCRRNLPNISSSFFLKALPRGEIHPQDDIRAGRYPPSVCIADHPSISSHRQVTVTSSNHAMLIKMACKQRISPKKKYYYDMRGAQQSPGEAILVSPVILVKLGLLVKVRIAMEGGVVTLLSRA